MRTLIRYSLAGLMIMGLAGVATAGNKEFTNWPAGMSPEEIGRKIVKDMLPRWIPRGPGCTTPRIRRGTPRWSSPS
ncbi:MAG: hypothetical protein WBL65_06155 [Bryobacteraceae bacterium]